MAAIPMSGYWFTEEVIAPLVRSISAIFECGDREILARVIEVQP
jgi:hypothetical protein